ncbi:recombinase family protein [Rhodobacteraceae bacterium CCMM004]|nr:recombinase family protein [Rhodobacteraceae bacterium CCMM004]
MTEGESYQTQQSAVIYCRVSSAKQKLAGGGLDSQEHRCRQYALSNNMDVAAVFPDDASGGGDFMKRPGMVALLSFLDAQPDRKYVVIFDDLKRFARDTQFHIMLRQEFARRGAAVECLNFKFEDTPEGRFAETIFAAQGELEREQNRRQTIQKMKARVEKGYYVFQAPVGYRYRRDARHGNMLVRDEPVASILAEALEGYALGRFQTQVEMKRFLESQPAYPKDLPNGEIRNQRIQDLLTRPVYAGMVAAPSWHVSPRKGHHEPLISVETFQRIQERLAGPAKAPIRKDINADFPLRGFVMCTDCGKPLTACWSTSKTGKRHAYYWCKTRGCASHRKSIRRDDLHGAVEEELKALQPTQSFAKLVGVMFRDAWTARLDQAATNVERAKAQAQTIERQIAKLLDRIVDAGSDSVIAAYEKRIADLEQEKLVLDERASRRGKPVHAYEEMFELAVRFLSNPWDIWAKGDLNWRRTVLRLAFARPITYSRKTGVRTPDLALPFKALRGFEMPKNGMARWGGFEPPTP